MSSQQFLSLKDYDVYGFDIDHTLAKYNIPELFETVYFALASYLVEKNGYAKSLLEPFDRDFCTRGLIFDVQLGNILKLAEDGTVLRASHGTKALSDEEISTAYGEKRHWVKADKLIEEVNNIDGARIFENFFDMPAVVLVARIVDAADEKSEEKLDSYEHIWSHVIDAFNDTYHPNHFALDKGKFFPGWKTDTGKYLEKCSTDIRDWLKSLKQNDKKVFIMTSSKVDFARASLIHIFGDDWKSYFDFFITRAKKPGFFTESRYFLNIVGDQEREPATELKEGEFYSQGNINELTKFLSKITGKEKPKVLYFGDSIRSDVRPAKKFANWDTVMVLEEIEAESHATPAENDEDEEKTRKVKRKRSNTTGPSELEKDYLTSQRWGSLFTDDNPNSSTSNNGLKYMNTLWGYIVRKYSDIAVPQLHYLAELPLDEKLSVFDHNEPLHWGFHPRVPEALAAHGASEDK